MIPNIWKNKKCSKPPTSDGFNGMIYEFMVIDPDFHGLIFMVDFSWQVFSKFFERRILCGRLARLWENRNEKNFNGLDDHQLEFKSLKANPDVGMEKGWKPVRSEFCSTKQPGRNGGSFVGPPQFSSPPVLLHLQFDVYKFLNQWTIQSFHGELMLITYKSMNFMVNYL